MVNEWNIRLEVLNAAHRWQVIVLFMLSGSLIGTAIVCLLPTPYRAETSLQVAYSADIHLRNPDDYKNWQMEQLNLLILSPDVLQETSNRLKSQSGDWANNASDDLAQQLHVYWRNAGEWRLVAEANTPDLAQELVATWEQVILNQIRLATGHANAVLEISALLDNLANELVQLRQRKLELEQINQSIQGWIETANPAHSSQPLDTRQRWRLLAQAATAAQWNPEGIATLQAIPPSEAPASDYLPWLEKITTFIDQELELLQPQMDRLSQEYDQLYARWYQERDASRGLTAYLMVTPLEERRPQVQAVRPLGMMIFVGGLLGLLAWGIIWLARPLRRELARV